MPLPLPPRPASAMGFPDESPSDDEDDAHPVTRGHHAAHSAAAPAASSPAGASGAPSVGSLSPPRQRPTPAGPSRAASDAPPPPATHGDGSFSSAGSGRSAAGGGGGPGSAGTSQCSSSLWGDAPDGLTRHKTAAALWELDIDEIETSKKIGEGSFGEVLLGSFRGTKVAVKRLRALDEEDDSSRGSTGGMGSQAAVRQFFDREVAILASIRHPNVSAAPRAVRRFSRPPAAVC
jgi:hypothetical protein